MKRDLQYLLDVQAIHDVLFTYCRGVDRCDVDLVKSVYHDDSYDDHGYWKGPGPEFAEFVVNRLLKANSATTHAVTNILVEIDADVARSEAQIMATLVRRDTRPVLADVMGARYVDRLSKRDGIWALDERTVVLDWHKVETWPESDTPVPLDGFDRGKRSDRSDSVFRMMATGSLQ